MPGNPAIQQGRVYACGARRAAPAAMPLSEPDLLADAPQTQSKPKPGPAPKPAAEGVVLCADAAAGKVLWETTGPDLALGGGQWSFTSVVAGSGVVCVLSNRLLLFSAADGKRVGSRDLKLPALKRTSLALAGDRLIARDWNAVVCHKSYKRMADAEQ
jgi:outer membrane protein assembly factor BamB